MKALGSHHTYDWIPPQTECEFREIRSVKEKIGKFDFLAEDGELYYEIMRTKVMALACEGNTVFLTNVRDIMIAIKKGVYEFNVKSIKLEEMLMGAEVRSLALFVKYKLEEVYRKEEEELRTGIIL